MLYKFVSENEINPYKGGFVVINDRIYTNPTEETIRKAGFKELVESEPPEYDEQKQYILRKYKDDDVITVIYEVMNIEVVSDYKELQ